jgi:hypothetical protein
MYFLLRYLFIQIRLLNIYILRSARTNDTGQAYLTWNAVYPGYRQTAMCGSGLMCTKTHILLVEDRRQRYDVLYCVLENSLARFYLGKCSWKKMQSKKNRHYGLLYGSIKYPVMSSFFPTMCSSIRNFHRTLLIFGARVWNFQPNLLC